MKGNHEPVESDLLLPKSTKTDDDSAAQFVEDVGQPFLVSVFLLKHCGVAYNGNLLSQAGNYLFRIYNVPATDMQLYSMVTAFPLAVQPMLCVFSDNHSIFGYHKLPYMAVSIVFGCVGCLLLGATTPGIMTVVMLMTLVKCQSSTCNVFTDTFITLKIKDVPQHGTKLAFFAKIGVIGMSFAGALASGVILQLYGAKSAYMAAFPVFLCAMFPVGLNWLGEKPCELRTQEVEEPQERDGMQKAAWCSCVYALLLVVVSTFCTNPWICSAVALMVLCTLLAAFARLLPPILGKFFAFVLLTNGLGVSYKGAAYYFYTDTSAEFPAGPHFSPFFVATAMQAASIGFGVVGLFVYMRFLNRWSYRGILLLISLVSVACKVMDAVLFTRFNQHVGLPDSALVLGEEIISPMIEAFRMLPFLLLMAHIAPKGMEATLNGLNASCNYIGCSVAQCFGALLLQELGCVPSGEADESMAFQKLWLAPVCAAALTLISGVGLLWLIPEGRQGDAPMHG